VPKCIVFGEEAEGVLHLNLFSSNHIAYAFKYRDRSGIMRDILSSVIATREGRKKTQIMQSANLNYSQTMKYLHFMTNYGYLAFTQRETYVITEKGCRLLQLIEVQDLHRIR
jgi:predicted transcriptional regulator